MIAGELDITLSNQVMQALNIALAAQANIYGTQVQQIYEAKYIAPSSKIYEIGNL